ncbi:SDR family NAD(P)-dependent oxidoreductase [Luteibacter sp.]|uniref:SDR family NAD(P)-dependent oxidoreductase n=1 Tax=Luteibacter sp. TaxID=1886636 RepID=UPI002F3F1CE4
MEISLARFTAETVLVTGAASGIGRAAARRFSDEGANVVIVDLDRAEAVTNMVRAVTLPVDGGLMASNGQPPQ